jgi:hypothetical protein
VDITRRNWQQGLEIDSSAGFPRWHGERFELDAALAGIRNRVPGDPDKQPLDIN